MAAKRVQVTRIEVELLGAVGKIVGQVQLRCLQTLASATPVDTGFARANWAPSTGSPIIERQEKPKDDKAARSVARAKRSANLERAKAIASTYSVRLGNAYLTNNVSYMQYLNEGSSAQAGAKFVEKAIEAAVRSFQGRRL